MRATATGAGKLIKSSELEMREMQGMPEMIDALG
jgi:hypothetical protein